MNHFLLELNGATGSLAPGDFVFLAPGVDHTIRSESNDDPNTVLLCGYCRFDTTDDDVLMRALPRFVLLTQDELEGWPWLTRTLEHLSSEYMSGEPGSELTVNKLTEVLLVPLLRADFGRKDHVGIIAALNDKRLAHALDRIHSAPGADWTLDKAAEVASMSRSGFARKFKDTLEMGFFEYLTRLRMRDAREMLTTTSLPVADVGERVGYQSELSFVKAFKKLHEMTPRAFRLQGETQ